MDITVFISYTAKDIYKPSSYSMACVGVSKVLIMVWVMGGTTVLNNGTARETELNVVSKLL